MGKNEKKKIWGKNGWKWNLVKKIRKEKKGNKNEKRIIVKENFQVK